MVRDAATGAGGSAARGEDGDAAGRPPWAYAWALERGMMVRRFGAGPPIVWIHGLGEWSASFDAIAHHAALAGFAHALPDLPGCGRSPWPAEAGGAGGALDALDALADQLAAWLAGAPPAVLVGHSLGGVLATLVAERAPVAGVVDVEGNLSRGDCSFSARAAAWSAAGFAARGFDELRADVYAAGARAPALRGYHAALCAASPAVFHRWAAALVAASEPETLAPRLAALRCPVLYVAGVPDGICAHSRALLDRHGVRWVGIEPAGHWVYVDRPDAFAAAVAPFAAACLSGR